MGEHSQTTEFLGYTHMLEVVAQVDHGMTSSGELRPAVGLSSPIRRRNYRGTTGESDQLLTTEIMEDPLT